MNKRVTKRINKFASFTLATTLVGAGLVNVVLVPQNYTLAAKNVDGVCEIESKSGQLTFNAVAATVTKTKPVDLLLITDGSGSIDANLMYAEVHTLKALVDSLSEDSRVMISRYLTNSTTSYGNTGISRMLTKKEAQQVFDSIVNNPGHMLEVYRQDSIFNSMQNLGFLKSTSSSDFEEDFAKELDPTHTHSVLQITDGWLDGEAIDTTFVEWAKANAKTFMSVIFAGEASLSYQSMVAAGHPNIYSANENELEKVKSDVIAQFRSTATEKVQPSARVQVNPEQGLKLKKVSLVYPSGKEEALNIVDNKVDMDVALVEDGDWKLKVDAEGLVPETRKVNFSATVGDAAPVKGEIVFDGCKDDTSFTYRILDTEGNVLRDKTLVSKGAEGTNYKLEQVPTLDGYDVVVPEGVALEGVFSGQDVNIDLVAYKLGGSAVLKAVDTKGVELSTTELIGTGKRVGTEYQGKVEKEIKKDGKVYRLVGVKKGETDLTKELGETLELKGQVGVDNVEYVATYEEVKVGLVTVEYFDEKGEALQKGTVLNEEKTLLGDKYSYKAPEKIKKGTDVYTLVKTELDGKEVKEIAGEFGEVGKTYKATYKKVAKPAPAKLPKTSADKGLGVAGLVSSILGLLALVGITFRKFR